MSTTPNTHPLAYKSVIMGDGSESPGVVRISGATRGPEIETKTAKGTTGATTVVHGEKIGSFTATWQLADLEEVTAWETYVKKLEASYRPKPNAITFIHPDLLRQRMTEVIAEEIGQLEFADNGMATVSVKFTEFRPPRAKAASKASGTGPRQGKTTIDPNAAAKRELAALLEQAKKP